MSSINTAGYKVFLADVPVNCLALEPDGSILGRLAALIGRPRVWVTFLDSEDQLHHEARPARKIEMIRKAGAHGQN